MTEALKHLNEIAQAKPDAEVRVMRRAEIDKTIAQQGDVYMFRVRDDHPRGNELGTRQVAVGTTVGSRHVVEGDVRVYEGRALPAGVSAPDWTTPAEILGPVVVAGEEFTLTHPEHAHHRLPAGTWQVTYQADYSTRQRVAD